MKLTKKALNEIRNRVNYLANEVVYLSATPGKELEHAKYTLYCMADVLSEYEVPASLEQAYRSTIDFITLRSGVNAKAA